MSIALNYPYNRRIADTLSHYRGLDSWEPLSNSMRGGAMMYAQPGSSAAYPMLNMVEQDLVDRGVKSKQRVLEGGSMMHQSKLEHKVIKALENSFNHNELRGGAIDIEKIKAVAGPVIKAVAKKGMDIGLPALGGVVGTYFGNPVVGVIVGKLAREAIKGATGFGLKGRGGVGVYSGGKAKGAKKRAPKKTAPKKGNSNMSREKRNQLVKKVMKERHLSLPEASKYIKEHNLKK